MAFKLFETAFWRGVEFIGGLIALAVVSVIAGVIWIFERIRLSRRAYVIRTQFDGDENAYEREKQRHK